MGMRLVDGWGWGVCLSENTCSLLQNANVTSGGKKKNFTLLRKEGRRRKGFVKLMVCDV
jgi:hypothetical protein